MTSNDAAILLKNELDSRKTRNSQYSLRSFSRFLEISPAHISQLISGKRPFTPEVIAQISEKLGLSNEEENSLLLQNLIQKKKINIRVRSKHQLDEDQFKLIAEWYHFAILSLSKIKNAKTDAFWIADRLGIKPSEAKLALARLKRLDLIADGPKLVQKTPALHVQSPVPSRAIQAYHRQILRIADERLTEVPVEKRDYSAVSFAVDENKLESARKMIEKFQDDLVAHLQTPNAKNLYMISCQLFPLERIQK